jgi:hypothetical protein
MSLTNIVQYAKDITFAVKTFETGFGRRDVVEGYFVDNELGQNQRLMYNCLLDDGFKRTPWQIVFPGQTAGLIQKINPPIKGMDEMHVRFYDDGAISAELEYNRFSPGHWRMPREEASDGLAQILNSEIQTISDDKKEQILKQITRRHYSALNPDIFRMPELSNILASAFIAVQYPLTTLAAGYYLSKGEYYPALEPGLVSVIETLVILGMILPKEKQISDTAPFN